MTTGRGSDRWPDQADGWDEGPAGGSPELDAALASLDTVGRREKQLLTDEATARLARAAARERIGSVPLVTLVGQDDHDGAEVGAGDGASFDPVPRPEPGHIGPPRRRRGPVLAVAAAAVLIVLAGAAVLSRSGQVVIVQDGAAPGAIAPDRAQGDRESRPILDLGEGLATTTTVATPPPSSSSEPAPNTPSSSPPPSSTAVDQGSTGPSSTRSQGASSGVPEPTEGAWLTIEVGVGATVDLRFDGSRPEHRRVELAPDWSPDTIDSRPGALDLGFVDGSDRASLTVLSQPGRFLLDVDHGRARPRGTLWTATYSLDRRGTVVVTYGSHGLSGLDIQLDGGWEHRVDTVGPDHLVVTIVDPRGIGRWEERIDAGPQTIDLLITGS